MKFSSLQENLLVGLSTVSRAVPVKGPLPVLHNVYISTEEGRVKLAATDMATTIMTYVGASIETKGATTVPAKMLKDFVNNLTPGQLEIQLIEDIFHIKSPMSTSKFNSIHADDFPELPEAILEDHLLEIEASTFVDTVNSVAFASGTDSSRPVFTGTLLKYSEGILTIASTDGYRLSEKKLPIEAQQEEFSAVIPTKTMLEVARIYAKSTEPIKFSISEGDNQVIFLSGDTYVSTRIIDGEYPPYEQIIPKESVLTATFSSEDFLNAIRLTSVFATAGDGGGAIKLVFDPEEQHIKVLSLGEETGEHESIVPAKIEGDLTEIAFQVKYLLDYLNNIKGSETRVESNGTVSPCVFKTKEHEGLIHIIMPVQI